MNEAEPNGSPATANVVPVSTSEPTVVNAMIGHTDLDYFKFTLVARSGVFFDTDAREIGIANVLDTRLTLFAADGTTVIANNDDGRDFDTLLLRETNDTKLEFGDSVLYADLAAGSYILQVHSWATPTDPVEPYQLKITANSTFTSSVPVFSSLSGAADTLYLDFDGHSATDAWGTYAIDAYDLNGNAAEWTPGERAAIETTWRVVADAFAPFNINVTTSYAGGYGDGVAHRQVIGNSDGSEVGADGAPGAAWFEGYRGGGATRKTGFTFADNFRDTYASAGVSGQIVTNAIEMGNTCALEIGRALGLAHYLDEAHSGAFMYTPDFGLNRERWSSGTNESGQPQDDMAVIAGAANTFGYRADDVGPTGLTLAATGNTYATSGVIHQTSDEDMFFFGGSGATTITLDIPEHWGHLDGEISVHTGSGMVLASDDAVDRLGATISFTLPAPGDYFVRVTSDGGEGEVGQYALRITTTTVASGAIISGRTFRDANYNGLYETASGDTVMGSVVVYLDANDNVVLDDGERSTTSSAVDGTYSFTGLPNGTYRVRQVTPAGHVNTQSYARTVTSASQNFTAVNFGNFPIVYDGSGGNDNFSVRRSSSDPARIEIVASTAPGVTWSAPRAIVPSITILGNGGDDILGVEYATGDPVPPIGGILFDGGASGTFNGNSVSVTGSSGPDAVVVSGRGATGPGVIALLATAHVTVDLLSGADTLRYATGSGNGGDDLVMLGTNNFSDADLSGLYGGIESFVVELGGGADNVSVAHGNGAAAVTINGGDGNDAVSIAAATGSSPAVTFNGEGGNDTLTIAAPPTAQPVFNGGLQPGTTDRLVVSAGNYTFNSDANTQSANLEVLVNAGGAVTFNSSQHLKRLELNGGSGVVPQNGERVIWADTLLLTGNGRLDLRDNDLIVRNADVGTFDAALGAYNGVSGYIASAYDFGAWDLAGLATTMTDAVARGVTTLGVARVSDIYGIEPTSTESYRGETVTGAAVVVKYTYAGDVNLDGVVDGADYGTLDNWIQFPGTDGYANGDVNYDGVIDGADYGTLDNSIQLQGLPL